jgi:predicted MPP superfamily phosphohydrolase
VFVAVAATVLVGALGVLVRMGLERAGRRERPRRAAVRWWRRTVLTLAAVGVACIAYGAAVEPYWPEVTRVRLETAKFPAGQRPMRIAQISDLHSDAKTRLEDVVPRLVADEHPDAIVFTGDAINSKAGFENFRRCMRALAAIAPTFAVRGNWDMWFWASVDLYADTGVRELSGDGAEVVVGDARVWICGAAVGDELNVPRAVGAAPPGDYVVFLFHYPDEIYGVARDGRTDLYCAGHTHGGQVALPLYGAIITLSRFGKRFESGLYRVDSTWLYVNRGIGMEGGNVPRVRFCARPEVTVFEISPDR